MQEKWAKTMSKLTSDHLPYSDMWMWQPLPVLSTKGLGITVDRRPCFSATDLSMNMKKACRSAVTIASSSAISGHTPQTRNKSNQKKKPKSEKGFKRRIRAVQKDADKAERGAGRPKNTKTTCVPVSA